MEIGVRLALFAVIPVLLESLRTEIHENVNQRADIPEMRTALHTNLLALVCLRLQSRDDAEIQAT